MHEQVLAGFDTAGGATKHTAFSLLNVVLVVATAVVIFVIVRAAL